MIRYLIIDDEYIAHDIIKDYCDLLPNMQLLKNCYDALEAFEYLNKNSADLIFLDLNMPILTGFEFLKTLKNPPKVIVTTAYQEYALEGYELNISDYLLKPFSFERFLKAINKTFSASVISSVGQAVTNVIPNRIFLQSNKNYLQVELEAVQYLEASGNYTKIVMATEVIHIREKISTLLEMFPTGGLLQVHKSFAVAPKYIKRVEGARIYIGEHVIPIGAMFKSNVAQLLK